MAKSTGENRKVLAVDMDEVLVNIAAPWAARGARRAAAWGRPWAAAILAKLGEPRDGCDAFFDEVVARRHRHIQGWLAEHYGATEQDLQELEAVYRQDTKFYDDLLPTRFAMGISYGVRNLSYAFGAVHVITHAFSLRDPVQESKKRWLNAWLPEGTHNGVTVRHHLTDRPKSEVMAAHCPVADSFADDDIKNHVDILTAHPRVKVKELTLPRYGYNEAPDELYELATFQNTSVNYYNNVR